MPEAHDIVIRRARAEDLHTLGQFLTAFVETGELLPRTLDELEELLPVFWIAERDGELVGCAALEVYSPKLAEIRSLAVARHVQGMGVGKRLVAACVEQARAQNVFEVMAISSEDDFFLACGFNYTLPSLRRAFFLTTRENYR
ncbi:MAG: GNAT family N-acetyltransferase [Anaerolineae bacterium]|nr:GNAT family N-acetyltransferase [Anaerolineae bacterium]MDW8173695.1 GNAT family N-acetyltransferase [Anaerolineae bacterium]